MKQLFYKDKIETIKNFKKIKVLYTNSRFLNKRPMEINSFHKMLENSDILISCWKNEQPIAIIRAISDFTYVTYISEIIVVEEHQNSGIGTELIKNVEKLSGTNTTVMLTATTETLYYYPKLGYTKHPVFFKKIKH